MGGVGGGEVAIALLQGRGCIAASACGFEQGETPLHPHGQTLQRPQQGTDGLLQADLMRSMNV